MHLITFKQQLSPNVTRLDVVAPRIAEVRCPGQFVIVRLHDRSERIPLTIAGSDPERGTITLVVQAVGKSTIEMTKAEAGSNMRDVAGPMGKPTDLIESGRAICVGGGVGTAVVHPIAGGLKERGVDVVNIIGGRSREWVIFEDELSSLGETIVTTDDGSYGRKGFVTDALKDLVETKDADIVYAVGPVPMMSAVVKLTKPMNLRTIVSLNPIMIDGTGMCGGCRVSVGGQNRFACVDGPEFDGFEVDFGLIQDRLQTYLPQEREVLEKYEHVCQLGLTDPMQAARSAFQNEQPQVEEDIEYGMPAKKLRMKIDRHKVPEQDPHRRNRNFNEVNLGFGEKLAVTEAKRCIECKEKNCIPGCPVSIDIPSFIGHIAEGNLQAAADVMMRDNALPAVTGRVCPQETQCEAVCLRGLKGMPVAIGYLERFVADWARGNVNKLNFPSSQPTGKSVAIVGSGPAGLTAAGELIGFGHDVTIFEAFHKPGGVLVYGIPEFRLPKAIVQEEVDRLIQRGVKLETNAIIGQILTLNELRERFDTVFIANGAGLPVFMNIPGENLKGVYSANEYLTRCNLMGAYNFPNEDTPVIKGRKVAVIGGGNTAMDAVRTARRLGAGEATIVYRRSRTEMPARVEEITHAEEEGIVLELLVAPLEILGTKDGWVKAMRCQRMELGEPDGSGRRRPMPIEGSEFIVDCDVVVVAVGTRANPLLTASCPDLELNKWGNIVADENGATSLPGVYAGGDITRGAATVILAMGDGKRAARAIDGYLKSIEAAA